MSEIVYRICTLLESVLIGVPLGTNLGVLHLFLTLLCGRFLPARGAVVTALCDLGLPKEAVRRAEAALCYGCFDTAMLLANWRNAVLAEGRFRPHRYEGYCPVACDTTGFLRPQLRNHAGKHYVGEAGKAVPAVVVGIAAQVGSVGSKRFALPRLLVRWEAGDKSETDLQKRLIKEAAKTLTDKEILTADAGFDLADLLATKAGFVLRLPKNFTARRNVPAASKGKGRTPEYGDYVRPLASMPGRNSRRRLPMRAYSGQRAGTRSMPLSGADWSLRPRGRVLLRSGGWLFSIRAIRAPCC